MAIKISGSTIIDDSRSLVNVGVSTISNNLHVGTGVTIFASSGIVSATSFFGSGQNLTDLIDGKIQGLTIQDEGSTVGTASSVSLINFAGNGVTAAASGVGATITIPGFGPDADKNLFAGDNAGEDLDGSSGCYNILLGQSMHCNL